MWREHPSVSTVIHLLPLLNWIPFSETRVDVKESVRGQDIFIIQTIPRWEMFVASLMTEQEPQTMVYILYNQL